MIILLYPLAGVILAFFFLLFLGVLGFVVWLYHNSKRTYHPHHHLTVEEKAEEIYGGLTNGKD